MPIKVIYECDGTGCSATVSVPADKSISREYEAIPFILEEAVNEYMKEHTLWYKTKDGWNCDKCKRRQLKPAQVVVEDDKSGSSSSSSSTLDAKQQKKRKIEEAVKQIKSKVLNK